MCTCVLILVAICWFIVAYIWQVCVRNWNNEKWCIQGAFTCHSNVVLCCIWRPSRVSCYSRIIYEFSVLSSCSLARRWDELKQRRWQVRGESEEVWRIKKRSEEKQEEGTDIEWHWSMEVTDCPYDRDSWVVIPAIVIPAIVIPMVASLNIRGRVLRARASQYSWSRSSCPCFPVSV